MDSAGEYLKRYPEARLILTGGNADASGRTQAAVMRDVLTERGVPEDRLILEDRAQTTKENFGNTAGIVLPEDSIVMISSNYHMDRRVRNASEGGFSQVMRLPAPSSSLALWRQHALGSGTGSQRPYPPLKHPKTGGKYGIVKEG